MLSTVLQSDCTAKTVQVLLEVDANRQWTPVSLELLSDARSLADRLKGGVGGWVLTPLTAPQVDSRLPASCGCEFLRQLRHDRFAEWSSEAIAWTLNNEIRAPTRLVLIPGSPRGEEVAALLAGMLPAIWVQDVLSLAVTRTGVLEITAVLPGGKLSRLIRSDNDGIIIATIRPGVAEIRSGRSLQIGFEEIMVPLDGVPRLTTVHELIPPDPKTIDITIAERIVAAGKGVGGPEGVALVESLAEALNASVAASRLAVDLGWFAHARQVGQTGRTVTPSLYVACGISGASHHVIGMRQSRHIVAINPDPGAPIHEVAHLHLQGNLQHVVPAILKALQQRSSTQSKDST